MLARHWGATADEISGPVVGDDLCTDTRTSATRCVTIGAPPAEVFGWIRQMGFGRAGWYSYDWLDNLGRRSATSIHAEWQDVVTGSTVPGGPVSFTAAVVDPPRAFVLQFGGPTRRLCFTLAYELREVAAGTRLVTRVRIGVSVPGGAVVERCLLAGDGLMVRRQLRGIAERAEGRTRD